MQRIRCPRQPQGRVDAILTSDWHLRDDVPVCRIDDFQVALWRKVDFVADLQRQYGCPVLHAGDLGHHWKWSPWLLTQAIIHLPKRFLTVFGQHCLPQHQFDLAYKSGVHTLATSERVELLPGVHFGQIPSECSICIAGREILVWHHLVWTGKSPWPGCADPSADEVLDKYPQYDLVLTGDNHQPFVVEKNGRLLVNPGSLTRQTADQFSHQPRVYLWRAESNTVEPVYLPIDPGAVTREHIEKREERDGRIDAFVSRLSGEVELGLSFEDNLRRFEQENEISPDVMDIIWRAIEC